VVIDDLHIFSTCVHPPKANTPLVVDSYAVLVRTLALESLQAIARRNLQVIQPASDFKLPQLAPRDFGDTNEPPDTVAF
jgi:hypothetical protein